MCTAAMVDRFLASKCTCRLYMVFVVNLKCNERRALKYIDQSQEWVFQEMWWWWRSGSTMKKIQIHTAACAVVIEIGFSDLVSHCIVYEFSFIRFSSQFPRISSKRAVKLEMHQKQNKTDPFVCCTAAIHKT